jgi:cytochrome c oxidase subunit 2
VKKSFFRYAALILVTGAITLGVAIAFLGSPSAVAQPTPAPAGAPAPAPAPAGAPAGGSAVPWYEQLGNQPIDEDGNFWMPKSVNLEADSTDQMYYGVLALSLFFFFGITIAIVYLVWKYRHRPGHKAQPSAAHHDAMEITWTVIPTIITVFLFYYGWRTYIKVVTPPTHAIEISVTASKWNWRFVHQNGAEDNDLHVPVGQPIRLVMTSTDVLHAFYAPAMRVKQDIIPRRYTYAWFLPTKPGTYRLTCAEYCGTNHAQMACRVTDEKTGACLRRAVVVVHKSMEDYTKYLAEMGGGNDPPDKRGAKLYTQKGCNSCHSIDGAARTGPTFKGAWGKKRSTNAGDVVMDEAYVRESVMTPNAKVVTGFAAGTMPSFEGQLKERDIEAIIAYLKSLQ